MLIIFLGYAIIKQIYADNPDALADAVIVSELGVAIPLFTLGVFIANLFCSTFRKPGGRCWYWKPECLRLP
ncbi:MAG: hypothetical protein U5Q03_12675 [Bacteroidota bacterium]|nr:hypothetical protein [Bacteroidota bacterium]